MTQCTDLTWLQLWTGMPAVCFALGSSTGPSHSLQSISKLFDAANANKRNQISQNRRQDGHVVMLHRQTDLLLRLPSYSCAYTALANAMLASSGPAVTSVISVTTADSSEPSDTTAPCGSCTGSAAIQLTASNGVENVVC